MKIFKTSSRFNRRITALQWHPWYNQSVAFASHGGDIHLWEFNNDSQQDKFINGVCMSVSVSARLSFKANVKWNVIIIKCCSYHLL